MNLKIEKRRVDGVTIAGNAHQLLARIRGIGAYATWLGSTSAPPMVIEGVGVMGG